MKEKLVEFLRPDKRKIALALLLPIFWIIFDIIFDWLFTLLRPPPGFVVTIPAINMGLVPLLLFLITYIIEVLFLYPFVCSIIILAEAYKEKRLKEIWADKGFLSLILLGILVFNPPAWSLLFAIFKVMSWVYPISIIGAPQTYGVYIIEVMPDSPIAKPPRLNFEMIIIKINDIEIENVSYALEILNNTRPEDEIRIRTSDGSSFYTHLGSHENFTRGYLGIKVRDAQGNEAIL